MAHRGPFRCECGELHDSYDESNDLAQYIRTDGVTCLNEAVPGACQKVFRPRRERGEGDDVALRSYEDDPELLIHVPFTVAVKISSLIIVGEPGGPAPAHVRAFVNQDGIDFSDVAGLKPVQEWDLAEGAAELEYPTLRAKFQNVSSITLHVTRNHGGEADPCATYIRYIAFKGEGTANRRGIVDAVYELRPVPKSTGVPGESLGAQGF
ncbi:DUF1000-domain-containing protein [Pavlovales sp. CCMP2436]|nr:DUF1000-domain-containing protein [Pavlovales sp. CCMP2436]|mmetsp:Transcript_7579/g.19848  ORF Transcript_7579/g.19848 Transcript_7579/m.19848 type:complete len:209 (+) Transcript_7579:31-657(+)